MALKMGVILSLVGEHHDENDKILGRCLDDTDGQISVDDFLIRCFKELIKNPLVLEHTVLICTVNYSRLADRNPEIISLARSNLKLSKRQVHGYFKNMIRNTKELTLRVDPEDPTNLHYADLTCSREDPLKALSSITSEPRHIQVV